MNRRITSIALVGALWTLSACDKAQPLYVDNVHVRLNANPDNPAAAYFTLHGGADPVVLREVTTDSAVRLEMHESAMEGGLMKMKPLDTVDVPARTDVAFAPGGKHLMLWTINPQAVAQGKMSFTFIFSNGERILVDGIIEGPDGTPVAPAPARS